MAKLNRMSKGVLLVNLGSPNSTSVKDVRNYLDEFLMDPRVIDLPYLSRALLVKGIILRTRPKKSAAAYQKVWTPYPQADRKGASTALYPGTDGHAIWKSVHRLGYRSTF